MKILNWVFFLQFFDHLDYEKKLSQSFNYFLESESKVVSGVEVSSSKPDDEMSSVLQAFKAEGNVTGGKK